MLHDAPMLLAIYSKGRFDKEARGLGVGDVFDIDCYASKHKGLSPLSDGGALFVVTVRPDDVLWLVAVLEAPVFDGTEWVAKRNRTPIRDITNLVGKIEFASGKGIKAGAGKLGMSLQTPRALSEQDIALLREAAGGNAAAKSSRKPGKTTRAVAKKPNAGPAKKPTVEQAGTSLERVARHLGKGWSVAGAHLRHERSGASFAYVPGGWLRMGFSLDDLYDACRARKRRPAVEESEWPWQIAQSRPAHVVAVTPFVIAVNQHDRDDPSFSKRFRHPSEAELEWVYRRCGCDRWVGVPGDQSFRPKNRWKLMSDPLPGFGLELGYDRHHEICADDWHDDYDGAPATSAPWGDGCQVARALHTNWQDDDEEMISLHAAYRQGPSHVGPRFRPTLALPRLRQDRASKERPEALEADQLMSALASRIGGDVQAAWWALELLVDTPASDVRVPLQHVIANLPSKPKLLRQALTWVGLITMGRRPGKPDPHARQRAELREALPSPGRSKAWKRLAALLAHEDKQVRAAAVTVVTAASLASGRCAALAKRMRDEPDKVVAAAIVIGLALLGQSAAESRDSKIERALTKVRVLANGLRGRAKPLEIATALDVTGMGRLPWFDGELEELGKDMLRALPAKKRERAALALAEQGTIMLDLVFEKLSNQPEEDPERRRRKLTPLRADELSSSQRKLLEVAGPPDNWAHRDWFRLPNSQFGHEIFLGRSEATWSTPVDTPEGPAPAYFAILDARAQAAADEVDKESYQQRVRELLASWTLEDLLKLHEESRRCDEVIGFDSYGIAVNEKHCHVAWPYGVASARARLIREAPQRHRRALRDTLLTRLRAHLEALPKTAEERWPETVSPLALTMSLDPGELVPADVLAAMTLYEMQDLRETGHAPVDFPEPEFGEWLRRHMEKHILRAIAGRDRMESWVYVCLGDIVSPRWTASSLLTILAYEMTNNGDLSTYRRIRRSQAFAVHRNIIPEQAHVHDDQEYHPNPRVGVKALWEAAQATRG